MSIPPVPPPKLHLNEHLWPRLATQLRRHGFAVTSTLELAMVEDDDAAQLAFAAEQHRAFVTFNHQDLVPMHEQYLAEGREHWGLILSTEENISVLTHRLLRLLNTLTEEELKNQIVWLSDFR